MHTSNIAGENNERHVIHMTIQVMSRSNIIKYSKEQHGDTSAVISISDCDKDPPKLDNNPSNGIIARCKVKFDDDRAVFDNPGYVLNMTCYRTVLNVYFHGRKIKTT